RVSRLTASGNFISIPSYFLMVSYSCVGRGNTTMAVRGNNDTTAGKNGAMKRRTFLSQAAGAAAVAIATPAIAQSGQVRWRMTTSWPKSLDTIQGSAELMTQRI